MRMTERQLKHFDKALLQLEMDARADAIDDMAIVTLGGAKAATKRSAELRKRR